MGKYENKNHSLLRATTNDCFAIVVSEFNRDITQALLEGALLRLHELGVNDKHIRVVHVPGAVEIPLTAKLLAQSGMKVAMKSKIKSRSRSKSKLISTLKTKKFAAIICLGAVIQGDTDHYTYVCQQVSDGCQQVMLEMKIPLIFEVLMTKNLQQAQDRMGGKAGHKGREAAETAVQMAAVVKKVKN